MSDAPDKQQQGQGGPGTDDKNIADYLSAPRKKRKSFIVSALGGRFDQDLNAAIEGFLRKTYPQFSIGQPSSCQELTRLSNRKMGLLIVNDELSDLDEVMQVVLTLKQKKTNETLPVLFFTREPQRLVEAYHNVLLPYHETDEFVHYPGLSRNQVFSRIKNGIDNTNRRKARRYKINYELSFYSLNRNRVFTGRFLDLSVHGAHLIADQDDVLFRIGDQLRLNIPLFYPLTKEKGDFLKIAAKVRRVFISGTMVGISFEYLSESQSSFLAKFLITLATKDMERQANVLRAKWAQQNIEE